MLDRRDNECREMDELAQYFWPAFIALCKKQRICVLVSSFKYGYIGWRDKQSNNPFLWMVKSFLKGFGWKFISCLLLGLIVSEIPYVVELAKGEWDFSSTKLIAPLCSALPALLGMALLDYLLDPNLSRTVLFPAILSMVIIAIFGYRFGFVAPNLTGVYIVTGCIVLMSWCIKVGDQRMMDKHDDAQRVLPKRDESTIEPLVRNMVRRGKKIITLNRNEASS